MILPKRIKIGFRYYTVFLGSQKDTVLSGHHGKSDVVNSAIYIDDQDEDQVKCNTLLHAIIHAIWNEYQLQKTGDDFEERGVSCLSNGLMQVMLDNPSLLRLFQPLNGVTNVRPT